MKTTRSPREAQVDNSLISLAISVVGSSHKKANRPCQDSSSSLPPMDSEAEAGYRFIAVGDGHGGYRYFRSDVGSELAVRAARECMTDPALLEWLRKGYENTGKERDSHLLWLKKSILNRWNALVSDHRSAHPFSESDLAALPEKYADKYRGGDEIESAYGSTIIAVLWTDSFLLAVQLGDGSCVTMDADGTFCMPLPIDENCFLSTTSSVCDSDAITEFRHYYTKELPAAVIISSDGVDDSFGFTDPLASPERLYDFYRVVIASFAEKQEKAAIDELADYLPRLSEKGSGDDISIGIIADLPLLRSLGASPKMPRPTKNKQQSGYFGNTV